MLRIACKFVAELSIVNQWKTDEENKERQFHIGDEVEIIDRWIDNYGHKNIVVELGDEFITIIDIENFKRDFISPEKIKKTGKHYDSIPLTKEENKE